MTPRAVKKLMVRKNLKEEAKRAVKLLFSALSAQYACSAESLSGLAFVSPASQVICLLLLV